MHTHTNTNAVLPMVIRMRMILSQTRTTSNTIFCCQSKSNSTSTLFISRPKEFEASLSHLFIFHLVYWRQHRSTLLRDTVSTTSLASPFIVPTLSVPTRNEFVHLLDSPLGPDPAAQHPCQAGDTTDFCMVTGTAYTF